ncbi:hypothetical protein M409DRAFT_49768 [Zasmidium cellare ATCC 36951]|uniref:peptidyl-tRNA hydrolase n=1 Tax=Zasmidium cellare ATCC 36951 TaxID=1080233 RepID=A0A6A6D1K2_ZASCE|nr:uncharacterized protein M409DRAFT_49768 [Zasmidium cellare ATCC 36951]KAF2173307.1 hypothetical protein M409DRAFT_49768 [Zasmidium cellare ATCC 36951]
MANVQDRGPPSAAAIAIGTALISGITGYYLGQLRSILPTRPVASGPSPKSPNTGEITDDDSDAMSDDDALDQGEINAFPDSNEECKLVLCVRTDLGMGKGKIAAQCSHATLACYKALLRADPAHPILKRWERLGQAKVALKVTSEDQLLLLQAQAVSLGICAQVIHDAGRTQIAAGSATVLGVGPAPKSKIDEVTGQLSLL